MLFRSIRITLVLIAIGILLTGCASTQVQTTQQYVGKPLPKPTQILVYDFAVSADEVKLNHGMGSKLVSYVEGTPKSSQELVLGHQVAQALSEELVKNIQALGLPARRVSAGTPASANSLIIAGNFLEVDQGNRLRRMVIGFGAGSTEVRTHTQVFDTVLGAPQLIAEFTTLAKSSKKPGIAALVVPGAAAGHVGTSIVASTAVGTTVEVLTASVQDDARRTAKEMIKPLSQFFIHQGWISSKSQ